MARKSKNKPKKLEKKVLYYRQCRLQKGPFYTTSWIPEKYAKKGKYVKLKQEDKKGSKKWDNGWLVLEVYDRQKEEEVFARAQDHKHQRGASDI